MTGKPRAIKLRAKRVEAPTVDRPMCGLHELIMVFKVENLQWECPQPGCGEVTQPKHEDGLPALGKGAPQLVGFRDRDDRLALFLKFPNNVMAPLGDVLTNWQYDRTFGEATIFTLTLKMYRYMEYDKDGNLVWSV